MDWDLVKRELERTQHDPRPGAHAESILRDVGIVAARSH